MEEVEDLVAREVVREGFTPADVTAMRSQLAITHEHLALKHQQVKSALAAEQRELEDQEERLIELAADGAVATPKLREKLNQITLQKKVVSKKLGRTLASLDAGIERALAQLDLLKNPGQLYRAAPGNVRRDVLAGLFRQFTVFKTAEGEVAIGANAP